MLLEVGGVPTGIASAMLRQEDTVRMVSPAGACSPNVPRTKTFGKLAIAPGSADVIRKLAHYPKRMCQRVIVPAEQLRLRG